MKMTMKAACENGAKRENIVAKMKASNGNESGICEKLAKRRPISEEENWPKVISSVENETTKPESEKPASRNIEQPRSQYHQLAKTLKMKIWH